MPLRKSRSRGAVAAALIFSLFQKSLATDEAVEEGALSEEDEGPDFKRIRCPLCRWHPNASSRWVCSYCPDPENFHGGCHAVWNTFETRGLCPGCGHQWRWTACLSCHRWSPHEDWYVDDDKDKRPR